MKIDIVQLLFSMLASTIILATPLIYAAMGGMFSERSGIANIGLEGMMTFGAFFSIFGYIQTGSMAFGLVLSIVCGGLLALLLGLFAIKFRAEQIVCGVAINIFALALPVVIMQALWQRTGTTDQVQKLPLIMLTKGGSAFADFLNKFNILTYLAVVLTIISAFVLFKTKFGLHLRAVGEHPVGAETVGISVKRTRYICVMISGMLAALGGAFLSVGDIGLYSLNMVSGRGFMALAALIFGKWRPWPTFFACMLFSLFDAVQMQLQTWSILNIPSALMQMIPYVITIIVLALFVGKSVAPRAVGKPYP